VTAKEIRNKKMPSYRSPADQERLNFLFQNELLQEIAAQLAEANELTRFELGLDEVVVTEVAK
jgi:hypothetical protein